MQNVNMTMSEVDQYARKTTTFPTTISFTAQSDIPVSHSDTLMFSSFEYKPVGGLASNTFLQIFANIRVVLPANYYFAVANIPARIVSAQLSQSVT